MADRVQRVGQRFGVYRLTRWLGGGSFGITINVLTVPGLQSADQGQGLLQPQQPHL
jgi:hypothetical protein